MAVPFLLEMMIDPAAREWYTCCYQVSTVEQANACDAAYNSSLTTDVALAARVQRLDLETNELVDEPTLP